MTNIFGAALRCLAHGSGSSVKEYSSWIIGAAVQIALQRAALLLYLVLALLSSQPVVCIRFGRCKPRTKEK
jgi:hypothetical protein